MANFLKRWMRSKNKNPKDLAKLSGASVESIYGYFNGTLPRDRTLKNFYDNTEGEINPIDLLGLDPKPYQRRTVIIIIKLLARWFNIRIKILENNES